MSRRKTLYERLVTILGDILVYRWPMFLLYDPAGYRVRGEDAREVLERVRPGDVLVRGYDSYLDGRIIPGYFSHVGLYLGEVTPADAEGVRLLGQGLLPGRAGRFRAGGQMVIHALAEGVLLEDVIGFCRCDTLAILRLPDVLTARNRSWTPALGPLSFSDDERALCERLRAGGTAGREEVLPLVRRAALGKLGAPYDFEFDFSRVDRLSCSELVYYATKAVGPFLDVSPVNRRFLHFLRHSIIEPDAFVRAPLELVWKSPSVDAAELGRLRGPARS